MNSFDFFWLEDKVKGVNHEIIKLIKEPFIYQNLSQVTAYWKITVTVGVQFRSTEAPFQNIALLFKLRNSTRHLHQRFGVVFEIVKNDYKCNIMWNYIHGSQSDFCDSLYITNTIPLVFSFW